MSSPSRVVFSCPLCNAPLRALAVQKGEVFACPGCSENIEVPASARPSAEGDDWWTVDLPETGGVPAALAAAPPKPTPPSSKTPVKQDPLSPPAPRAGHGSSGQGSSGQAGTGQASTGRGSVPPGKPDKPVTSVPPSKPAAPAKPAALAKPAPSPTQVVSAKPNPPRAAPPAKPPTPISTNQDFEDPDDLFGKLQPLDSGPAKPTRSIRTLG